MRTVRSVALIGFGLVIASCGGGTADDTTVSTAAAATSTPDSAVATTASAAPTTTSPESTTTVAAETTTPSVSGGSAGFQELLVKIDQAGEPASARVEGSMEIVGAASPEGPIEIIIPFSAAFDVDTGNSSFSMDMSAMAETVTDGTDDMSGMVGFMGDIEVREIGDTSYIRFGFFNQMLGAQTEWVSMPKDEGEAFSDDMAAIPTNPNSMLDSYRDADAEVEELGRENVNGVDATHYLVTLDAAAYLETLTEAERAELEETSPLPDADLPMELWISDEGHIVRMVMDIDGSAIEPASPEDDFERMTFTYDIFDIGEPVTIEAPPASDVTAVDGLMGGFGTEG